MGSLIYLLISHMQFWAAAVIAYFCGCFNGAVIVSKYILRDDVRNHGSGNAGLTNFFRTFGGPLTFVVILCDVLKAVVAIKISVWLGGYFDPRIMPDAPMENQALLLVLFKYWGGLFCLLGHMFPCMFHFKGGKGILSGGTIAIMIDWRVAVVVWGGFLMLTILTRYVSSRLPVGRGQLPVHQLVLLSGSRRSLCWPFCWAGWWSGSTGPTSGGCWQATKINSAFTRRKRRRRT